MTSSVGSSNFKSEDICSITLKPFENLARKGKLVQTSCGHMFSRKAIEGWMHELDMGSVLRKKLTCPCCHALISDKLTPVTIATNSVAQNQLQQSSSVNTPASSSSTTQTSTSSSSTSSTRTSSSLSSSPSTQTSTSSSSVSTQTSTSSSSSSRPQKRSIIVVEDSDEELDSEKALKIALRNSVTARRPNSFEEDLEEAIRASMAENSAKSQSEDQFGFTDPTDFEKQAAIYDSFAKRRKVENSQT